MAYTPKRTEYKLVFTDEDMRGLEIVAKKLSLRSVLRIRELGASNTPDAIREMAAIFIGAVRSWNLADDSGVPIAPSLDALLDQEDGFLNEVIGAYNEAVAGVSAPLDDGSTSGATALEASIPMETSSPSLSS